MWRSGTFGDCSSDLSSVGWRERHEQVYWKVIRRLNSCRYRRFRLLFPKSNRWKSMPCAVHNQTSISTAVLVICIHWCFFDEKSIRRSSKIRWSLRWGDLSLIHRRSTGLCFCTKGLWNDDSIRWTIRTTKRLIIAVTVPMVQQGISWSCPWTDRNSLSSSESNFLQTSETNSPAPS